MNPLIELLLEGIDDPVLRNSGSLVKLQLQRIVIFGCRWEQYLVGQRDFGDFTHTTDFQSVENILRI